MKQFPVVLSQLSHKFSNFCSNSEKGLVSDYIFNIK